MVILNMVSFFSININNIVFFQILYVRLITLFYMILY